MAPLLPNQPSPLSAMENVNELTSDLSISRTGSAESSSSSRAEELSYREYQAHMRVKAARGDSRLRVAETKTDLATDLNDAGEYEKASEELKEAIAIYEELRPEVRPPATSQNKKRERLRAEFGCEWRGA